MSALVGTDATETACSLQVGNVLLDRAARNAKCGNHARDSQLRLVAQQFPNSLTHFLTAFSYRFFLTAFSDHLYLITFSEPR